MFYCQTRFIPDVKLRFDQKTAKYFMLTQFTSGSSKFEIDAVTGTINLVSSLDYEENAVIHISVLAESDLYERAVTEV